MRSTPPHKHLFIVRIWRERDQTDAPGPWRGSVEHIPSGQRRYFDSVEALSGFIAASLAPAGLAPPSAPEEAGDSSAPQQG